MPVEESNPKPKLIFSCSGAADTGEIAHQATRYLSRHGKGRMFCLAGIGGRVEAILDQTRQAEKILALDGCDADCARKTLELAGFTDLTHLRVTDLGLEKGASPVTQERVSLVTGKAEELLGT
jgi:uncharacterized metal-binding protein